MLPLLYVTALSLIHSLLRAIGPLMKQKGITFGWVTQR